MATTSISETSCTLGPNISVRGTLSGRENLIVEGRLEGSVNLEGHLTVAEVGVVHANIEVQNIDVYGEVAGDIVASETISIQKGSRVSGNVRAPRVLVHDGAHFEGTVTMDVDLPDYLAKAVAR